MIFQSARHRSFILFYFITSIIWSTGKLSWLGAIQLLPQSVRDGAGTRHGQTLVKGTLEMLMHLGETSNPSALFEAPLIYFFVRVVREVRTGEKLNFALCFVSEMWVVN